MSNSVYINIDDIKTTKPSQAGQPTRIDIKPNAKVYKRGGSGKKSFVQTGTASALGIQDAQSRMIQQGLQEQARQQELIRQEQAKAQAEKIRIEQLNRKLLAEGARQRKQTLIDQAGDRIRTTTTEINRINKGVSTNAKIYKYENLDTGETRYTTYEKPRSGMPRRLSGGVTLQGQSSSDVRQIKNELSSAGLVPVTNSYGQIVAFRSPDTRKSYAYNNEGLNAYQRDSANAGAVFRKEVRENQELGMSRMKEDKNFNLKNTINKSSVVRGFDKLFVQKGITKSQESTINNLNNVYNKIKNGKKLNVNDVGNIIKITNIEKVTFGKYLFDKKNSGGKLTELDLKKAYRLYGGDFDYTKFYDEDVQNAIKFTINASSVIPGAFIPASIVSAGYSGMLEYGKQKRLNIDKKTEIKAKELALTFGKEVATSFVISRLMGLGGTGFNIGKSVGKSYLSKATIKSLSKLSPAVRQSIIAGSKIMGTAYAGSIGTRAGSGIASLQRKDYGGAVKEGTAIAGSIIGFDRKGRVGDRFKKGVARRDILTAKTGELVPLKDRITQIDFVVKNSGKKINTITAKPSKTAKYTNVPVTWLKAKAKGWKLKDWENSKVDITYGKTIEFSTYNVGKAKPTSLHFIEGKATELQKAFRTGRVNMEGVYVANVNKKYGSYIKSSSLKDGRVPESFIKKYYTEALAEANRLGRAVIVISPKRLRGFGQSEQEIIKILPTKYIPKKLKFAGLTEDGYKVFSDEGRIKSLKEFAKSKFTRGKIERSYFKEITGDKLKYLKGRKTIRGEYKEHGLDHLTAKNTDTFAQRYAKKMNVKKFGNVFKQHDLAVVGDNDSFAQFQHGKVLYNLWKKGQYPDKNIYKLPKKLQKQIAEAYAGHTPVRPGLIDTLKKGFKDSSITKDLIWWAKNKRNPYLQDTLTLDRIELPRAGRWDYRVKYNLLDKNALKRIYGSELNAIKNIKFLDWNSVPRRLLNQIRPKNIKLIKLRDAEVLRNLKANYNRMPTKNINLMRVKKYVQPKKIQMKTFSYITPNYKRIKDTNFKIAYKNGYKSGYEAKYNKPTNYKTNYGKYQTAYSQGYKDAYKGNYKITPSGYTPITPSGYTPGTGKYEQVTYNKPTPGKYEPSKYTSNKYTRGNKSKTIMPLMLPKSFKPSTLSKAQPTFYVVEKVRGKYKKLYPKPLTMKDAKDYATYSIDNRLSKTAFFIPLGKSRKVIRPPIQIQNYYAQNSQKFRPYRIQYGQKKQLVNGFIEKRKYFNDKPGERIASRNLRARVPVKRTITPMQRQILLKRLAMARAVRMRNLRR